MGSPEKKQLKAAAKAQKKLAKSQVKAGDVASAGAAPQEKTVIVEKAPSTSPTVRFAEAVRGILFLIFAISLVLAIVLSEGGVIITLDEIIDSLLLAWAGKVALVVIALAFFVYGLKYLRLVK